jgi:hydrogenase maturation protease
VTTPERVPRVLVAGIGNILLQDDGFGPQTIARLQAEFEIGPEAELLDLGTPALDFVDYLFGREVLILIDALSCGGEPGEILTYDHGQLRQHVPGMRLSAHQPCLQETLFAAETAGIDLREVVLVGIVGYSFDVGTELSECVSGTAPRALEKVCEILSRHGVKVSRRKRPVVQESWWNREASATT